MIAKEIFPSPDRDWCIGLNSQRLVHRLNKKRPSTISVWDCKPPETKSHSHFNCTIARLHLCVNHISTRMLLCYSASCQIVPKTVRPSQCRGETSLHNSVKCARAHFYPPREEQYRGGVSEGVIFGEMCNLVRELATQPGKPWVRVHQS